eukprot:690740-Prymnesium_polylepis.1
MRPLLLSLTCGGSASSSSSARQPNAASLGRRLEHFGPGRYPNLIAFRLGYLLSVLRPSSRWLPPIR